MNDFEIRDMNVYRAATKYAIETQNMPVEMVPYVYQQIQKAARQNNMTEAEIWMKISAEEGLDINGDKI